MLKIIRVGALIKFQKGLTIPWQAMLNGAYMAVPATNPVWKVSGHVSAHKSFASNVCIT